MPLSVDCRQDDPLDAAVDDLAEDRSFVRARDEVAEILAYLDRDGAVLVGDETNLVAVATTSNVIGFCGPTRPLVLQDMEHAGRDLIRSACPSSQELAERTFAELGSDNDRRVSTLEELIMGSLLGVLLRSRKHAHRHMAASRQPG